MAVTKDFLENYQQKYIMPFSTGSFDLNDANFCIQNGDQNTQNQNGTGQNRTGFMR